MVIAGVADRMPERIKTVVFLDAFVPSDGENVYDQGYPRMPVTGEQDSIPVPEAMTNQEPPEAWTKGKFTPQPRLTAESRFACRGQSKITPFAGSM
jgi:hypothetical protein